MTTLQKNVRRFALILGLIAVPLTGKPRHVATARLCLQSEATGVVGPCLVIPVGIA